MKSRYIFIFYCVGLALVFTHVGRAWAESPATTKIVFMSSRDGNSEIYTMNPDGKKQVNLSRNAAEEWDPVWSPNGEQILFVSNRDGPYDLYVMDADGRGVRKVFKSGGNRTHPTWAPDGKKIAYVQGKEPNQAIYIATRDGRFARKLTDGFMPSWSPDGHEIAFVSGGVQHARLSIFDLRTHTPETLLQNRMPWVVYPTWSPHGDKIAFSEIDGAFHQGFLQWTRAQLYTVNRDGTGLHRIIKDEKAVATESTWSPDSDQLIHTDFVIRPNQFSMQLFKTDIHGRNSVQLTHEGDNNKADWFDPTFAYSVQPQPHLLTTTWGKIKIQD